MLLMFNNTAVVWVCIIVGIVLVIGALGYIYYRVKVKSEENKKFDTDNDYNEQDQAVTEKTEYAKYKEEISKAVEVKQEEAVLPEVEAEEVKPVVKDKAEEVEEAVEAIEDEPVQEQEALPPKDICIEVLHENANGKIEIINEDDCFKLRLTAGGIIAGESDTYQTKLGLLKGLKSLVNYADTPILDQNEEIDAKAARFEVFADKDGKFGYYLKTKIKTKLTGSDFETREKCLKAIDAVKKIGLNFNI